MRAEYIADDFMGTQTEPTNIAIEVEKKVSLLYDLCVLRKRGFKADEREEAVRKLLLSYETPLRMDNAIHDVVVGNCTMNELLKRKEVS